MEADRCVGLDEKEQNSACSGPCCHDNHENQYLSRILTFCALHLFGFDKHTNTCPRRNDQKESTRDTWLKSFGLLRSEDMAEEVREFHLVVGYRPIPSTFTYCLKSIFYPTNETMNFWTHFIALIVMVRRFHFMFSEKLLGPVTDPLYYPLWVYAFGCCGMFLGSCLAHVFSCYSKNVRETCWFCDYAGVTLSSFGITIAYHFYVCPYECMGISTKYYIEIMGFAGVVGHAVCCYSRRLTSKIKYVMRSGVFLFLYIISYIPCSYLSSHIKNAQNFNPEIQSNSSLASNDLRCHIGMSSFSQTLSLVAFFSFAAMFFNVTKLPEKYFPGTFDIIGHSHQWLHIGIALAFYTQSFLIEDSIIDMNTHRSTKILEAKDFPISWWNPPGIMAIVGILYIFICWYMTKKLPKEKQKFD